MEVLKNKGIFNKLIIVLLVLILFNVVIPKPVKAVSETTLLNPIMNFFVGLGDGAMTLLQSVVFGMDESIVDIDTSSSFWSKVLVVVAAVVACAAMIAMCVVALPAASLAVTIATITSTAIKVTLTIGAVVMTYPITTKVVEGMLGDSFELPIFAVTPQEIFANKVPLLDVDFFNPKEPTKLEKKTIEYTKTKKVDKALEENSSKFQPVNGGSVDLEIEYNNEKGASGVIELLKKYQKEDSYKIDYIKPSKLKEISGVTEDFYKLVYPKTYKEILEQNSTYVFDAPKNGDTDACSYWITYYVKDGLAYVNIQMVEATASDYNKIIGQIKETVQKDIESQESIAKQLQGTVSSWYIILRNIALVALLSVLVYSGIRIMISSVSEKAKYKEMLVDWLVAVCLLFFMQYIMAFSNLFVNNLIDFFDTTTAIAEAADDDGKSVNVIEPECFMITDKEKVQKAYEVLVGDEDTDSNPYARYFYTDENCGTRATKKSEAKVLLWPAENFMQQARINLQFLNEDTKEDTYIAIGWKLIYVVLVLYTFIFLLTYLKRVIYMTFLTIIAPLVAMTYPIDKMNDGQAQGFNMWFKEYIFNLLLQPLHLIMYTILISSAMDLASRNIIYVVVCLGFMVPAEKILRKFFGFEKAMTPGMFSGAAGTVMSMGVMSKLLNKGSGGKGKAGVEGKDKEQADDGKIKYSDGLDTGSELFAGGFGLGAGNVAGLGAGLGAGNAIGGAVGAAGAGLDAGNAIGGVAGAAGAGLGAGIGAGANSLGGSIFDAAVPGNPRDARFTTRAANGLEGGIAGAKNRISNSAIGRGISGAGNRLSNSRVGRFANRVGNTAGVKALKAGTKFYGNGLKDKFRKKAIENAKNANPIRSVAKFATGAATATAGMTAGALRGIVSGDITEGIKYGAIGAAAGWNVGKGGADKVANAASVQGVGEEMERAYLGDDAAKYKERQIQDNIREAQHNFALRNKIEKKFKDPEKAKAVMENVVPDCVRYGLNDANDIIAVAKLQEEENISRQRAMSVVKEVNAYGEDTRISNLSEDKSSKLNKTIRNRVNKNANVQNEEQAKAITSDIRRLMDKCSEIKYD